MPFFIPVDYFDERIQFNNNLSVVKGRHSMKFGVEFNRVHSNQTFRGFQNGRYIFGSTDGFLNYAQNPQVRRVLERHDLADGRLPGGRQHHRPAAAVPAAVRRRRAVRRGGGHAGHPADRARRSSRRTSGSRSRSLTVHYGLRWEMQKQADMITPANEVFYAPLIGETVTNQYGSFPFPSNGDDPVGLPDVAAARRHLVGPGR